MPLDATDREDGAGGDPAIASPAAGSARRLTAHAKINLALHILGRRGDGYHALDSLVAFAAFGDTLTIAEAKGDAFSCDGPFAGALSEAGGEANSVMAALTFARAQAQATGRTLPPLALHLHKTLPVASGIGGGSADAGALLRHFAEHHPALAGPLRDASVTLGADVPMCVDGVPARVEGIGEIATPLAAFPSIAMVLVNPGVAVSTPAVFGALACRDNPPIPPLPTQGFADLGALLVFLEGTRNDLEAPALSIAPGIAEVRDALVSAGARFARMSGSGATVFGLFASDDAAARASHALGAARPGWWIKATRLMGTSA